MKRKYHIVLALVFCAIFTGSTIYLRSFREPTHQGRYLSEWLTLLVDGQTPQSQTRQAEDAIRCIGTNALPHLLRMVQERDSPLKRKVIKLAEKQSVIRFSTYQERLHRALAGFKTLGAVAEPALIDWIENKSSAEMDEWTRSMAIMALLELGPATNRANAIPTLIKALKREERRVRSTAAASLGEIGQESSVVVPALVASLSDPDPIVRGNSVGSLSKFGEQAKSAVPALEGALHDSNRNVRGLAALALKSIEPERGASTPDGKNLLNASPD